MLAPRPALAKLVAVFGSMRRRPRATALVAVALPSLLAGYELAVLFAFLNPELPYGVLALLRGSLALGLLVLPLSAVLHLIARRRRNVRYVRLLPWSLTAVLVAAALGYWIHASIFSFYLPPGLGASLIKCALWLTLGAILSFYTALLHTAHHRRYGPRSVALLVLVAIGTLYVSYDRRASVHAPRSSLSFQATSRSARAPTILVVEIDGATLDVLLPLARQSRLPFFSTLLETGISARLATVPPLTPAAARATLATGKFPFRHRVVGNQVFRSGWISGDEFRIVPLGFERLGLRTLLTSARPTRADDRTALTVAEILVLSGYRTAVLGIPAVSIGAAPFAAAASDERFLSQPGARQAVPASLEAQIALLDESAGATASAAESGADVATVEILLRFSGELRRALMRALSEDRRRVAVAKAVLASESGIDALFLRLDGFLKVARVSRGGFERAELEGSRGAEERRAAEALTAYCARLDSALEELWKALAPPRVLVVASPYGVDPPRGLRRVALEVRREGRLGGSLASDPDGALWMRGESFVRFSVSLPPARIVDVAPTILYLAGMPIARDLDGRVLTEALEPALLQRQPLTFLPSHEALNQR